MTTRAASPARSRHESAGPQTLSQNRRGAACSGCRNVKAKCETDGGQRDCTRCQRRGETCERSIPMRGGRPKGSKNQQTALEKAWQVIEREVHRSKRPRLSNDGNTTFPGVNDGGGPVETRRIPPPLTQSPAVGSHQLDSVPRNLTHRTPEPAPFQLNYCNSGPDGSMLDHSTSFNFSQLQSASDLAKLTICPQSLASHSTSQPTVEGDHEQDNGLSNPVKLLADAAEENNSDTLDAAAVKRIQVEEPALPPQYTLPGTIAALLSEGRVDSRIASLHLDNEYLAEGLQSLLADTAHRSLTVDDKRFFKPSRIHVKRDLGPEYDPLDLALVTMKEVKVFFTTFFAKLHPVLPVMDPCLHTPEFVRARSAFLLTAVCAHGASLTVGSEQATRRLRIHAHRLSELISRRAFASVEIVQAFLVWISWLPSSQPLQEEKLWHETKFAINMAVELEVAKPRPIASDPVGVQEVRGASLASCLEDIVEGDEQMMDRMIRNRQRLWVHLFLWDSSLSLAFGKATRFTQDYLTRDETWCFHPLATPYDRVTTACVVLRRRMVGLSDTLRSEILMRTGSTSEWVISKVDEVLDPWHTFWTQQCGESPYLELVYRHSRLWSLSYALQNLSSRGGLTQAVSDDCFASAVSTCEFVCEQLRQSRGLWGFPNTMGPMLSFEVLLAVRLFPSTGNGLASRARVLGLLAQLSLLLERVGTTPPHRLGTAAVYGRHLQVYLRRRIISLCVDHERLEPYRLADSLSAHVPVNDGSALAPQQAEMTIDQLFASNRVSPTDQAQSAMALTWNDVNSLNFLDTAAGWTEDFFRIFGDEQVATADRG